MPADHKSQSEADWAYAKRALARGDSPELVIQRIKQSALLKGWPKRRYGRSTMACSLRRAR
jgi:hypothetical protein